MKHIITGMTDDKGLGIKTGVCMRGSVINEHLIDEKSENDHRNKLSKSFELQPHHEIIRMWVKLLKDIWIGEEKKIIKVIYFFIGTN